MIRLFCFICLFFLTFSCFSQTGDNSDFVESGSVSVESNNEFMNQNAFFLTFGTKLMINTDDKTKSAPSPIMFSLGFGYDFFQSKIICGQVRGSFFTNYYLWDGENAQPAEVENRTATALSCMIDLLAGHNFRFGKEKFNQITIFGGVGILTRYALLSSGVNPDDEGGELISTENGKNIYSTANEDVSSINSWFYSNMNFLYPEIAFSYLKAVPNILGKKMFGAEFRTYFSLGSIISGDFLDSMIFDFAIKFRL